MASFQIRQRDPLLDQNTQAMLERRGRELIGLALVVVAFIFTLILGSYSPEDPGWMVATQEPASNIFGRLGAGIASTLMILIGRGAWSIPVILAAWGCRFLLHRGTERILGRIVFAVIAVALAAAYASTLVAPTSWAHSFGLGGLFGDTVAGALIGMIPGSASFGLKLLSLVTFAAMIAMMFYVTGFDRRELRVIRLSMIYGSIMAYSMARQALGKGANGALTGAVDRTRALAERRRAAKEEAAYIKSQMLQDEADGFGASQYHPQTAAEAPQALRAQPRQMPAAQQSHQGQQAQYAPRGQQGEYAPQPLGASRGPTVVRRNAPPVMQEQFDQGELFDTPEDELLVEPLYEQPAPRMRPEPSPMRAEPAWNPAALRAEPRHFAPPAPEMPKEKLGFLARMRNAVKFDAEPDPEWVEPQLSSAAQLAEGPDEDRIKARISDAIRHRAQSGAYVNTAVTASLTPVQAAIAARRAEPPVVRPRGPRPLIADLRPGTRPPEPVMLRAAALADAPQAMPHPGQHSGFDAAPKVSLAELEGADYDDEHLSFDEEFEMATRYGAFARDPKLDPEAAYQAEPAYEPSYEPAYEDLAAPEVPVMQAPKYPARAMAPSPAPAAPAAPLRQARLLADDIDPIPANIFVEDDEVWAQDDAWSARAKRAQPAQAQWSGEPGYAWPPGADYEPIYEPEFDPIPEPVAPPPRAAAQPAALGGVSRQIEPQLQRPIAAAPAAAAPRLTPAVARPAPVAQPVQDPRFDEEEDEDYDSSYQVAEPAPPSLNPVLARSGAALDRRPIVTPQMTKPLPVSSRAREEAEPRMRFEEPAAPVYELPPLSLLASASTVERNQLSDEALEENARMLESVLDDYGVKGEIVAVRPGPVVTMYELEPAPGLKASRVIGLADDIARSMSALSARVSTVPGRSVIGIELPNAYREKVVLREILSARDFGDSQMRLPLALGKDIGGEAVVANLAKMPHLLIAGTTGSGKSVAINTMILSLLYKLTPEECRLIMIDPKMLELSVYDGIPHLLSPVVTDPKKAVVALKWVVGEMEERYRKMSKMGVRNIEGYNARVREAMAKGEMFKRTIQTGFDDETGDPVFETEEFAPQAFPYIVVIVDEMADLMMVAGKEIEACIQRLAQMARASGIHLIMATQRPSVDVITGTIKANFPTRISFQVTSKIDSRTILGEMGAEQLLGQGDMLYMGNGQRITRIHGPFVSDEEVEEIVNHLKSFGPPTYMSGVVEGPDEDSASDIDAVLGLGGNSDGEDSLYDQAVAIVAKDRKCSTSYIQRKLGIGYNKAARLVEQMEEEGVVTPANHVGKREILLPEH